MRIVTAGAIAVVALLAHAGAAPATPVSLGQTAPAGAAGLGSSFVAFQSRDANGSPSYRAPGPGVITNWNVRGGNGGPGQASLKVFRETSPGHIVTVDQMAATTVPTNALVAVSGLHIRVQAGDLLGLKGDAAIPVSTSGLNGDWVERASNDPQPGEAAQVTFQGNLQLLNTAAVWEPDNDADGLGDDSQDVDDDNDGVSDAAEIAAGTNPLNPDTDGDGLPDGSDPRPLSSDRDHDGIDDAADNCAANANPDQANADGDHPGDVCDPDDDNDGLSDVTEAGLTTNPFDLDSDDDGVRDDAEVRLKLNPRRADTDRDGLRDGLERGLTKGIADPAGPVKGTDPRRFARDRDPRTKTNARIKDTDRDGLSDGREDRNHNGRRNRTETNPLKRDTDHDGIRDGRDHYPLNHRRH